MKNEKNDHLVGEVGGVIDSRGLIAPMSRVVVGVSGGADSVALLSILRELGDEPRRKYRLVVAHLNHRIRDESDADEAWVQKLADGWGISCVTERVDVPDHSRKHGISIEQAAREARYDFLSRTARQVGAGYVALGHHADDNVETVLYRIARGTHIRGLCGIPPIRQMGRTDLLLVRPLLHCRRSEIESYCRHRKLDWLTDATNADTVYRRNFIRHELLPLLRKGINPRADEAILRLSVAANDVEEFIESQCAEAVRSAILSEENGLIVLDAARLSRSHRVVQAGSIREILERLDVPMRKVGADRIGELCSLLDSADQCGAVALPGDFEARRERREFIVQKTGRELTENRQEVMTLQCPGRAVLPDGREVVCEILPFDRSMFKAHCRTRPAGVELLDADKIVGSLVCRRRREGDSFKPLGSTGSQKVGDFLTNLKLPARRREDVLCICDDDGIVHLWPLRIAGRVKVTERTGRIVRITTGSPGE